LEKHFLSTSIFGIKNLVNNKFWPYNVVYPFFLHIDYQN
jgi:hypothetical protein